MTDIKLPDCAGLDRAHELNELAKLPFEFEGVGLRFGSAVWIGRELPFPHRGRPRVEDGSPQRIRKTLEATKPELGIAEMNDRSERSNFWAEGGGAYVP